MYPLTCALKILYQGAQVFFFSIRQRCLNKFTCLVSVGKKNKMHILLQTILVQYKTQINTKNSNVPFNICVIIT